MSFREKLADGLMGEGYITRWLNAHWREKSLKRICDYNAVVKENFNGK